MLPSFAPSKSRFLGIAAPVLALAFVLAAFPRPARAAYDAEHPDQQPKAAAAAEKPAAPAFALSEAAIEAFGKMKPLLDQKNWVAALKVLDDLLPTLAPDSYDMAVVLATKSELMLQLNDYAGTIQPLETALHLAQAHHYFDEKQILGRIFLLAQIYYQESTNVKAYPKETRELYLQRSIGYVEQWLSTSPKPDADVSEFYARILYEEALTKDPQKPDSELIQKCQDVTEKIIATTLHPKDIIYVLLLATLQQQSNYVRSAEILELLVSHEPGSTNKQYWQQLEGYYLTMAAAAETAKKPEETKKYYARAINTVERAQARGFLSTPRDNYNLVTIYYTVGQFGKATELLYAGLKEGKIESDIKNWELLATSYQQIDQPFKAIEVLKEAAQDPRFANNGQIDFQIGQIYSGLNRTSDAYSYIQAALEKYIQSGGEKTTLDHPFSAYLYLAYTAFELQKFPEALDAVNHAATFPDAAKDKQIGPLRAVIQDAIKERAQQKDAVSKAAF